MNLLPTRGVPEAMKTARFIGLLLQTCQRAGISITTPAVLDVAIPADVKAKLDGATTLFCPLA